MRPIFSLILLLLVTQSFPSFAEQVKLAAIVPLTGNAAEQGEWARRGFEIARDELKKTQGLDIAMTYEDSHGGDPGTAVKAYRSLQLGKKIPVVFSYGSGVGMALTPLVNSDRVVQMGIATATPKYSSPGDFTFRNFPSAELETNFLVGNLIHGQKIEKLALLNIMNDYGVGTADAMVKTFTSQGGTVVYAGSYAPDETNFRSMLLKLKGADVQGIYLAAYPTDGALILKQARQLGLSQKIFGSVAIIGGKNFFDLADTAAEGLMVVSSVPNRETPFFTNYTQLYPGEAPAQMIYAARAYDALIIAGHAIVECKGSDSQCIRDKLFEVKDYSGPSGTFSFDGNGDMIATFKMFTIRGKAFEVAE